MDNFYWSSNEHKATEALVCSRDGVGLYDGDDKCPSFDCGTLILTTHRLLWRDSTDFACVIACNLKDIKKVKVEPSGFRKSSKITLTFHDRDLSDPCWSSGQPIVRPKKPYMKFSFRQSGEVEFQRSLEETLSAKVWMADVSHAPAAQRHFGIAAIEKRMAEKHKTTDRSINEAFDDLESLIKEAQSMVSLSKAISQKLREKQQGGNEDEAMKFKQYLLSMGIQDPITRSQYGGGSNYFQSLARQLSDFLEKPLQDRGGVITLTDAYCFYNRARGLELISPEDLVTAAHSMNSLKLPVQLKTFDSGVMVLQLASHNEEALLDKTMKALESRGCMSAEDLARSAGISVVLARERLLLTEARGLSCRDDAIDGLSFYPNMFNTISVSN